MRAKGPGGLSGCDKKHSCRAGYPLIPPSGTFSPHGVEKDRMHASALPMPGVLRLNVQRGVVGRSMVFGCPSQRLPPDERPAAGGRESGAAESG